MLLLTRPEQKLKASITAFRKAGIDVTGVAPLTIAFNQQQMQLCKARFSRSAPDIAIVTSTFAAKTITDEVYFRSETQWLAVGTSSADILRSAGLSVTVPEQQNSEGLLTLTQLNGANCQQIVIIKGKGGRTTLPNTLRARGHEVEEYLFYSRKSLAHPIQTDDWQWPAITGIVATSGEMAEQLFRNYDKQTLCARPWLTVSHRIAEMLQAEGVSNIAVCDNASDIALIAWIKDNWE